MKPKLLKLLLLSALTLLATALPPLSRSSEAQVRYCCTTQQVQTCLATGGTTSCRTNDCRYVF
jgi:hypothetical protein